MSHRSTEPPEREGEKANQAGAYQVWREEDDTQRRQRAQELDEAMRRNKQRALEIARDVSRDRADNTGYDSAHSRAVQDDALQARGVSEEDRLTASLARISHAKPASAAAQAGRERAEEQERLRQERAERERTPTRELSVDEQNRALRRIADDYTRLMELMRDKDSPKAQAEIRRILGDDHIRQLPDPHEGRRRLPDPGDALRRGTREARDERQRDKGGRNERGLRD